MGAAIRSTHRQGRRRSGGRRVMSEINVTPLVDVMLVLLVIFMVTAPLLTTGIPLDLPKAKAKVMDGSDKALNISIDSKGDIYLGTDVVRKAELVNRIEAMIAANPELNVMISGDVQTAYGRIIEVMALLKNAGYQRVGLKTEPVSKAGK